MASQNACTDCSDWVTAQSPYKTFLAQALQAIKDYKGRTDARGLARIKSANDTKRVANLYITLYEAEKDLEYLDEGEPTYEERKSSLQHRVKESQTDLKALNLPFVTAEEMKKRRGAGNQKKPDKNKQSEKLKQI